MTIPSYTEQKIKELRDKFNEEVPPSVLEWLRNNDLQYAEVEKYNEKVHQDMESFLTTAIEGAASIEKGRTIEKILKASPRSASDVETFLDIISRNELIKLLQDEPKRKQ